MAPMTFERFGRFIMNRLGIKDVGSLHPDSSLFDELHVDSFQAYELLIVIEMAAELDVPPAELPEIYTLGDAYTYYQEACRIAADERVV